jgi:hypothetical protein
MARSITGGCSCGTVRYECSAEPVFTPIVIAAIANKRAVADLCRYWPCPETRSRSGVRSNITT